MSLDRLELLEGLFPVYPLESSALLQDAGSKEIYSQPPMIRAWAIHHRKKTDVSYPN